MVVVICGPFLFHILPDFSGFPLAIHNAACYYNNVGQAVPADNNLRKVITMSTLSITDLGISLAIADLADAKGLSVEDVVTMPHVLEAAGLPHPIAPAVARRAHQLYRNAVDGMLWRGNVLKLHSDVRLTKREAEVLIEEVAKPAAQVEREMARHEKAAKAAELTKTALADAPAKPKAGTMFDLPATAIVRWLGAYGMSLAAARVVLAKHGLDGLSDSTIKIQLRAGVSGDRGGAPALTDEQVATLLGGF
jgi:hypothetical protein